MTRTEAALDPVATEWVAIGAAVAANCQACFTFHYNKARELGVSPELVAQAVRVAQGVKGAPARALIDLAAELLGTSAASLGGSGAGLDGGCGGEVDLREAAAGADDVAEDCGCGGETGPEVELAGVAASGDAGPHC